MLKKAFALAALTASTMAAVAQQPQTVVNIDQPRQASAVPSSMSINTDVLGASKVIFPNDWQIFTKPGMDVRRASSVSISAGESWVSALERWAAQEGMSARLDWANKRGYLDQVSSPYQPPMSGYAPMQDMAGVAQQVPYGSPPPQQYGYPQQYHPQYAQQHMVPTAAWEIKNSDVRLDKTLERWAQQAGYTLIWDADRHVLITAEDHFTGTFEQALERVLNSPAIRNSDYPLEAAIYSNNPPVLRISALGEQSKTAQE